MSKSREVYRGYEPGIEAPPKSSETLVQEWFLRAELTNIAENIGKHTENFITADKIMFILGCDDGRVGAPPTLQTIKGKQVLMVYVPRIGGGVPNKDFVQYLYDQTKKLRGSVKNVEVIVTQHGSSDEVAQACGHGEIEKCTCGLRAVFSGKEKELSELGEALRLDQADGRKVFTELPRNLKTAIRQLSQATGIPERLIRIAAETNFASNITVNALNVASKVSEFDIFAKDAVQPGYFDHNSKVITLLDAEGNTLQTTYEVSDDKWLDKEHQDPKGIVVSFGPRASFIPDGVILPESVGLGINNDFTAVAPAVEADFEEEDLLNALAEASYAANAYKDAQEGNAHGKNFVNVEYCAVLCDNAEFVATAERILGAAEFNASLAPIFAAIGEIKLIDIETGDVTKVSISKKLHPRIVKRTRKLVVIGKNFSN